jgi:hypothetical protein
MHGREELVKKLIPFIDMHIESAKSAKEFSNGLYTVYCPKCFSYEHLPPAWLAEEGLACPLCGSHRKLVDDVFRAEKAKRLQALRSFVEKVLIPVVLKVFGDDLEWWRGVRRAIYGDEDIASVFWRWGMVEVIIGMDGHDFVLAVDCEVPELLAEFDRVALHQPEKVLQFVEEVERQRQATAFRAIIAVRQGSRELKDMLTGRGFAKTVTASLKCIRKTFAEPVLAKIMT